MITPQKRDADAALLLLLLLFILPAERRQRRGTVTGTYRDCAVTSQHCDRARLGLSDALELERAGAATGPRNGRRAAERPASMTNLLLLLLLLILLLRLLLLILL